MIAIRQTSARLLGRGVVAGHGNGPLRERLRKRSRGALAPRSAGTAARRDRAAAAGWSAARHDGAVAESRPSRNGRRSLSVEIEHADDVRRQREDDVGLLRFLVMCWRTAGR